MLLLLVVRAGDELVDEDAFVAGEEWRWVVKHGCNLGGLGLVRVWERVEVG